VLDTYDLTWTSSSHERYETNMLEKARAFLEREGVEVIDEFSGTDVMTGQSDNVFVVRCDQGRVFTIASKMNAVTGTFVRVELTEL
jgi:hypothetical protein